MINRIYEFFNPKLKKILLSLAIFVFFIVLMLVTYTISAINDDLFFLYKYQGTLTLWPIMVINTYDLSTIAIILFSYYYFLSCSIIWLYDNYIGKRINNDPKLKEYYKTHLHRLSILLIQAVVVLFLFISFDASFRDYIFLLLAISLFYIPVNMNLEYTMTTNKSAKDAYNEFKGKDNPFMHYCTKMGMKLIEEDKERIILSKGKEILETKTIDKIPNKYIYSETYINNHRFADSKIIFKEGKIKTEIIERDTYKYRLLTVLLFYLQIPKLNRVLIEALKNSKYHLETKKYNISF